MNRSLTSFFIAAICLTIFSCTEKGGNDNGGSSEPKPKMYVNPVVHYAPDPSIIDDRERSGYFYVYSTQAGGNGDALPYLPIWKSKDLVLWESAGDAFKTRPTWVKNSRIWAPDINYINGQYVLYYALGCWDESQYSSVGVAVSDNPEGPFNDLGLLVNKENTGVSNSIDANFFDDGDAKYLFWGSVGAGSGIWVVELTDDGLSVKEGSKPIQVGNTNMEGTYVHKHDGYYYLFGSMGSCCLGEASTYHIIVARSENVLGPYKDPNGKDLKDGDYNYTILSNRTDKRYVGVGHNAEIVTDDSGQDWMPYHAFFSGSNYEKRALCIDKVFWENGWPKFEYGYTTASGNAPVIK